MVLTLQLFNVVLFFQQGIEHADRTAQCPQTGLSLGVEYCPASPLAGHATHDTTIPHARTPSDRKSSEMHLYISLSLIPHLLSYALPPTAPPPSDCPPSAALIPHPTTRCITSPQNPPPSPLMPPPFPASARTRILWPLPFLIRRGTAAQTRRTRGGSCPRG